MSDKKNNQNLNDDDLVEQNQEETENLNDENRNEEFINLEKELEIKNKKIDELEKENLDYKDKLLRKAAEFENYKRRTEKDQLNLINYAAESFITKLLPVVDDFERSLEHINNAKDASSIGEGVKLVYEKLMKLLDEQGVKKIDSTGKPFDFNLHEAVSQQKNDSVPPHTVIYEVEKGYMYKDRVIRHAKVVVSEDGDEHSHVNNSDEISDTSNNE